MHPSGRLTLLALLALSSALMAAGKTPNVLLIVADDWRADLMDRGGKALAALPAVNGLARSGVVFENAYSPGTTAKAQGVCRRAPLFSGRSPLHVKAAKPDGLVTMPSFFKEAGYKTSLVGALHAPNAEIERLFEKVEGQAEGNHASSAKADEDIATSAIQMIKAQAASEPWLMCVSFTRASRQEGEGAAGEAPTAALPANYAAKPRQGYLPEDATVQTQPQAAAAWGRYLARIQQVDRQVGRILASLEESGDHGATLIVFTSASGAGIGSHGLEGRDSVYEEVIHVPLIMSGVGLGPDVNRSLVSMVDVFPTLMDFVSAKPSRDVDGHSLKALLMGSQERVRTTLFASHRDTLRSMRDEQWKLIVHLQSGELELYDLRTDPLEMHDVSAADGNATRMSTMLVGMRQWQHAMGDFVELPETTLATASPPSR